MMHRLADSFEALSRDRIGGLVGVEEDRELRAQTGEKMSGLNRYRARTGLSIPGWWEHTLR